MRLQPILLGAAALIGAGLVVANAAPPEPAPSATPAATQPKPSVPATPAVATPADTKSKPDAAPNAASAKEKPLIEAVQAFVTAYNAADIDTLVGLFTEDADVVDPSGSESRGNASIAAMYAASFEETTGLKLESEAKEIKFITADVARVAGQSRLSSDSADANEFTRFSALMVNRGGKWLVAELREYAAPSEDVAPAERLKELEWMVGDWVDEGDDNKVTSNIRWADKKSFLVRNYTVELKGEKAHSGTMFIGWDPQSGQIKSWLFDSEGGHGEGFWTRTGEKEWVVKAQGVLHDGRPTSATQVHTIMNKDVVKTSSIDRIIGGQIASDIVDVVMVRKPPQAADIRPKTATVEASADKPAK
jgi:uncharacterized protein (TIGR02246 family)